MKRMVLRGELPSFYDNDRGGESVPLNVTANGAPPACGSRPVRRTLASAHAADLLHRVVEGQVSGAAVVGVAHEVREQAQLDQCDTVVQRLRLPCRGVERVLNEDERLRLLGAVTGQRVVTRV